MRRCLDVLGVAVLLGGLPGCGDTAAERPRSSTAASFVVNEATGSVAGIRIGDSARRVRAVLGRPRGRSLLPAAELGLPWIVEPPPAGPPRVLSYDGVSVMTFGQDPIKSFTISSTPIG